MREREREVERDTEREVERHRERERGRERLPRSERERASDRTRGKERWSENRRTPTGSSWRRRSLDRKENLHGGQRINVQGRVNTLADEDNWTTVVTRRSKKIKKQQRLALSRLMVSMKLVQQ